MRRLLWLGLPLVVATTGCGGGPPPPPGPVAGEVTLSLQTPNIDDGAVLIRVVGAITKITPLGSYTVSHAALGAPSTKVVVVGNLAAGPLIKLAVPDINQLTSYSVFVEQVASRTDFVLYDPAGYSVLIVR